MFTIENEMLRSSFDELLSTISFITLSLSLQDLWTKTISRYKQVSASPTSNRGLTKENFCHKSALLPVWQKWNSRLKTAKRVLLTVLCRNANRICTRKLLRGVSQPFLILTNTNCDRADNNESGASDAEDVPMSCLELLRKFTSWTHQQLIMLSASEVVGYYRSLETKCIWVYRAYSFWCTDKWFTAAEMSVKSVTLTVLISGVTAVRVKQLTRCHTLYIRCDVLGQFATTSPGKTAVRLWYSNSTVWVKKIPPTVFWNFFPNG